jgi:hypothetical protein
VDASVAEAAAGALGLFIKALNLGTTENPVAALEAIGAIALSPDALPQATAGVNSVVHALRHSESTKLTAAACKTLGIYLRCPATRERAVQAGAEAAIRKALAEHSEHTDYEAVQAAANVALQNPQA